MEGGGTSPQTGLAQKIHYSAVTEQGKEMPGKLSFDLFID